MQRHLPRRLAVAGATAICAALLTACGGAATEHGGGARHGTATAQTLSAAPPDAAFNDVDVRFSTDMIPHHRQALEMARIARARATHPEVRALAERIEKAQDPEINIMSEWLRDWGHPVPSAAPGAGHGAHAGMPGMMTDAEMRALMTASGSDFDRMFLHMMIRHHEGAVTMATTAAQQGKHPQATQLAGKIAADQAAEVRQMRDLLARL